VFRLFAALFEGPNPLDKRLGATVTWRVRVISVRLDLDRARRAGVRGGEAVITYDREVRYVDRNAVEPPSRYVATVRYEYRPQAPRTEADRLINPFGFVVTAYRSDIEVGATR
jgi:type IV secretion system protein VirB8